MGGVPAFLPGVFVAEESNGGWEIGLQMREDVDFGVFVVIGGEGGVEPQVGDDAGIDVLRVRRVVEAGIHGGEGLMCPPALTPPVMMRCGSAELACVLFEPADGAFGVGDADAFAGFTCGKFGCIGLAEHLILRRGADESATGKVSAGDAELPQRTTGPCGNSLATASRF